MDEQTTGDAALSAEEIERIKKLQKLMAGLEGLLGDSWLFTLLQAFLGSLTGYDPDLEGVDGARSAEEEQAGERDYEGRRPGEERDYGKYKKPERFVPQSIDDLGPLKALKEKYGDGLEPIFPVAGKFRISSDFGERTHPKTGEKHKHHAGLDIAPIPAGSNPDILAPMPGMITEIRYRGGYGLTMDMIDIYGVKHRFAHLKSVNAKAGDVVEPGEAIAVMGTTGRSTGVHLHYEQMDAGDRKRDPKVAGKTWREAEDVAHLSGKSGTAHAHADDKTPAIKLTKSDSVKRAAVAAVSFNVVPPSKDDGKDKPPAPSGVFAHAFSSAAKALGLG